MNDITNYEKSLTYTANDLAEYHKTNAGILTNKLATEQKNAPPFLYDTYPDIMTMDEVKKCLRISNYTLYRLINSNALTTYKIFKRRFARKSDVIKLTENILSMAESPLAHFDEKIKSSFLTHSER